MRFLGLILIFASAAASALDIPKGLTAGDRKEVVRTVGLSSANKFLTNPYPLGGYSGFEIGYSLEFVNVRDIRRLGSGTSLSEDTEWRYSRLTVGKGLYEDVDVFFSFIPPTGGDRLSDYGGFMRWSFFQAQFLPINVSALVHYNQLNLNDVFTDRNFGTEIMAGVNVDNFALYFGGGVVDSRGTFTGGTAAGVCDEDCRVDGNDQELNADNRKVSNSVRETHTVIGLSLHYENLFAAAQVDRYRDAVYSLKVGMRF